MKAEPFFSVVIPTFNRVSFIDKTIGALLLQTFQDFEIIVIDDGSTDATETEMQKYAGNEKVSYYKTTNHGVAHARNTGIKYANGKYISFLDSDDFVKPEHLQTAYNSIQQYKNSEIIHLNFYWSDPNLVIHHKNKLVDNLPGSLFVNCFMHVNCIFIPDAIAKNHLFNESRDLMFAEDWDFFIKLAIRYNVKLIDVPTAYLIDHGGRNMKDFHLDRWEKKREALKNSLSSDEVFMKNHNSYLSKIMAHMNSLIALNLVLSGERMKGLSFLTKSLRQNFGEFFTKRTIAIFKHLLVR